jgi:Rap1a immunity proteins
MLDSVPTRWYCVAVVLLSCLLAPMLPSSATAVTGNDWRALPASAKTAYVSGVVDNLVDFGTAVRSLVPVEKRSGSERMLVRFEDCIAKTPRPPSQLVAIVDKYVKENPGQWHARMSGLVFEALRCKDSTAVSRGLKGE